MHFVWYYLWACEVCGCKMNVEEFRWLLKHQPQPELKPWEICPEGVWCSHVNTYHCNKCTKNSGGFDHFDQGKKCLTYSFRPNGYWPRDHLNRMEREESSWNFVNRGSS